MMKSIQLLDYDFQKSSFKIFEKPIPDPKDDEVLIKIYLSPINPSDLMYLRGLYGIKKKLPSTPGFEGGGTVVKVGSKSHFKEGDRVSCVAGAKGDGTWAEYMLVSESNCIKLLDSVSLEQGSLFFVNPLTAYFLFEIGRKKGHTAFLQTAAASALGKMLGKLANYHHIPMIHIVRKESQKVELQNLGFEKVLNSEEPNFQKELFKLSKKFNTTYMIDAVGGETASKIFMTLPYGAEMVCYGNLSEKEIMVQPGLMIFQDKKISGFWLSSYISSLSANEFDECSTIAQELIPTCFQSHIQKKFPLESIFEAIEFYKNNMSLGKIVIQPDL
jgi:NADPH:quinone reductase